MPRDNAGTTIKQLAVVVVAYAVARVLGWDGSEVADEPLVWIAIVAIGLVGLAALLSRGAAR